MRVAITTVKAPFIDGGAEAQAQGLRAALAEAGYHVDIITMPFRFFPDSQILRAMEIWRSENLGELNFCEPDLVICLKFPTYYLDYSRKTVWLLHQFRAAYDLFESAAQPISEELRAQITAWDNEHLGACKKLFADSQNVASRLHRYNGLRAQPLYHPPPGDSHFYSESSQPYIFFPSRLETLKRQSLLVEAMRHVRSPVVALIAGTGGQYGSLTNLVRDWGLQDRVRLLGDVSRAQLLTYYACCLAVFFGPFDEDYGYVTLEAMLSAKPVITCSDSGGPLEFVVDGETGLVVEPQAQAVADAIDQLCDNKQRAAAMGLAGKERYAAMGISWRAVVDALTETASL